jgi:hypothetical protein
MSTPTFASPAAPAVPTIVPCLERAFVRADLAPVPATWRIGGPDFVAIGCGKAGSTWWWSLIDSHPDVVPNRLHQKELHDFLHFGWHGPDDEAVATYRSAFAAPAGKQCGDGSFNYLTHPLALDHLWRAAPEAKLIALLRNPVDRLVSTYDMFLRRRLRWLGLTGARADVTARVSLWDEAFTNCRVADGLRMVRARWRPEQVLVLQYEACCRDPRTALQRTYRFLGLDERYLPADLERRVNDERHELPAPDHAARARIAEYLAVDVEATLALCPDLERGLWPDFDREALSA